MANVNAPHGLRPLMRNLFGGPIQIEQYSKPSAQATIYRQDPVIAITGGTAGADGTSSQNIGPQATAGAGTFVGVALNYGATGAITQHSVVHSPDALFEIQDDGASTGVVVANLGKNANTALGTAGNASTQISGAQLGTASIATTAALDLSIHRLLNVPDNAFGVNARVEVTFGRHQLVIGRTGV